MITRNVIITVKEAKNTKLDNLSISKASYNMSTWLGHVDMFPAVQRLGVMLSSAVVAALPTFLLMLILLMLSLLSCTYEQLQVVVHRLNPLLPCMCTQDAV